LNTKSWKLGFIGAGNMAEALTRGVIRSGLLAPAQIIASDLSDARRTLFENDLKVRTSTSNKDVAEFADILFLCVKPQQTNAVLTEIAPLYKPARHLLASICAGVTTARMEGLLPVGARTVRIMPNTPMLVGLGASGLCGGANTHPEDLATVETLLQSCSMTVRVAEHMMDAVTGVSGSGPAYLFYLVEAMVDAGIAEGFSREEATALATRTVLGAAKMLDETKLSPEELRKRVTSPNGTTQAAVERMDSLQVKAGLTAGVRRAAERSRELGKA